MKVAIITGAGAMDSKTLARFLQYKNYKVILTFRRNSLFNKELWFKEVQLEDNNLNKFYFESCDITDQNSVRELIKTVVVKHGKIDELYMIAAMSHVGDSFKNKETSIITNGQSYYFFLESLKEFSSKTKVYGALTSELAGNVIEGEYFDENFKWNPKSPYAIGKALGGHWIKFYRESLDAQMFACFGILFNHSNIFRSSDFFISKCCKAAANIECGKQAELILGNLNFYRDEHWSDFGVEMMWKMLQQDIPSDYVIGTGAAHHGEEYLDSAFGYFNLDWKKFVKFDKNLLRPNEVKRLISNSKKAQKELGWNPHRITFKQHIGELCGFYHNSQNKIPNFWEKYPS
jgi:GDPmannose 4,6-dehydratase